MNLQESLIIHSELNPKLFKNGELKPEVNSALFKIADTFIEDLQDNDIPLEVVDIWLVGSNASYNYTDQSDIDIHIIANMDVVDDPYHLLSLVYNYAKASFNKTHDIKVKGHPVEVYIEDSNTTSITNGIYSIYKNEWIKKPEPLSNISEIEVTETLLYKNLLNKYNELMARTDDDVTDEINEFFNNLYVIRKVSLINDGEFGEGNLVFKQLRNDGILDNLKELNRSLQDKELTLESKQSKKKDSQVRITYGDPAKGIAFFNAAMGNGGLAEDLKDWTLPQSVAARQAVEISRKHPNVTFCYGWQNKGHYNPEFFTPFEVNDNDLEILRKTKSRCWIKTYNQH